jgi:hypothetical protein
LWLLSGGFFWRLLKRETARIDADVLRAWDAFEKQVDSVALEIHETLASMEDEVREAVDVDVFEQMEIMRQGIINNFLQMGIGFIGKKMGMEMGVHQIEPPEPSGDTEVIPTYDESHHR